jgi:hypothetical protein
MEPFQFAGFVGPAYEARSRFQDAQRCINWYPEPAIEPGAKTPMVLYPTPGTRTLWDLPVLASIPAAEVRLLYSPASRRDLCVIAVGNKLLTAVPNGATWTFAVTNLQSNVGAMSAADNGTTILIVDGTNQGYTVNIANGAFGTIGSDAFFGANTVVNLDAYFVLNKPGTRQFYVSGLAATTFDALDFASKEAASDLLVAVWAEHRELWLLGQYTTEVWYNSGGADFPFSRNDGVFLQHGCGASASISRLGETFAFLGINERGSAVVLKAQGYGFAKISTPALDFEFSTYEKTSDAVAFTYRSSGHEFYQLTFPTANKTWVYDDSTGFWHERAWLDRVDGKLNRHRANCFANYGGRLLVGDFANGKVHEYLESVYTDNGDQIVRLRRTPHIVKNQLVVRYSELQVEFEPGVGLPVSTEPLLADFDGGNELSDWTLCPQVDTGPIKVLTEADAVVGNPEPSYRFTVLNSPDVAYMRRNFNFGAAGEFTVRAQFRVAQKATANAWSAGFRVLCDNNGVGAAFNIFEAAGVTTVQLLQTTSFTVGTVLGSRIVPTVAIGSWNTVQFDCVRLDATRYTATLTFFDLNNVAQAIITAPVTQVGNQVFLLTANNTTPATIVNFDNISVNAEQTVVGRAPQAMMRWSDDGGFTWSSEHWTGMGAQGQYFNRAVWRRMGAARDRVFEVRVTDPVKAVVIGSTLRVT